MSPFLKQRFIGALSVCMIFAVSIQFARGQEPHIPEEEAEQFKARIKQRIEEDAKVEYKKYREKSRGPNSDTDGVDNDPVTLEAGQANGKGTISWKPKGDCVVTKSCWSINLSAPTDKDAEQSDFTNLDGLAKDLALGFDWRKPLYSSKRVEEFVPDLEAMCEALDLDFCHYANIASETKKIGDAELIKRLYRLNEHTAGATSSWFVKGKVSVNEYEFFNVSEVKTKSTEIGMSLKGGYSRVLGNGRASIAVAYQRSYKASKTNAQLCEDVGTTGTLESCKTLPLGAPQRIDSPLLQIEYRRRFKNWVLSPLISRDFEQDVTGIEIPIYLYRDGKGLFTGGFKLGWRSDKDKLEGSVFVSKPLELL